MGNQNDVSHLLFNQEWNETLNELTIVDPEAKDIVLRIVSREQQTADVQPNDTRVWLRIIGQAKEIQSSWRDGINHKADVITKPHLARAMARA